MRKVKKASVILLLVIVMIFTAVPLTALGAASWEPNTVYKTGDIVTYGTDTYQCVQGHTSLVGWEPPNVPALWSKQSGPADTQPPTVPTDVTASNITSSSVTLSWTASTDNVGVTGYDIFNGTTLSGSSTTPSYMVTGLTPDTSYTFTVNAKDAAGNISPASSELTVTTLAQNSTQYEIISYFPSWAAYNTPSFTPADVDPSKVTVINYAFLDICWNGKHGNPSRDPDNPNPNTWPCQNGDGTANNAPNGSIVLGDPLVDGTADGGYNQLVTIRQLKNTNPNLKLFASVGGWTWSNQFSNTANDPVTRGNFATSAVNFLRQYQFDGIDIDWEYPNSIGVPCASGQTCQRTADKANYILLLQTLRQALDTAGQQDGKHYYITIASSANSSFLADAGGTNNWLSTAAQYLDWINIMTYDYYGPWDATSGITSPLYNDPANPYGNSQFNINSTVTNYLNKGISPTKITIGEPFYGYGWKGCNAGPNNNGLYQSCTGEATGGSDGSTYDFAHMQNNGMLSADSTGKYTVAGLGYTRYWNNVTQTPFLYNPSTKIFITYDDEQSIHLKNEFIQSKGLRGAMFWELNADRNRTLQSVVSNDLPH